MTSTIAWEEEEVEEEAVVRDEAVTNRAVRTSCLAVVVEEESS
jgi:hypothetical protein